MSAATSNGKLMVVKGGVEETPLVPPRDINAEAAVLGAALTNSDSAAAILGALEASEFYLGPHRRVFGALGTLHGAGDPIDLNSVVRTIKPGNEEDEAGWRKFLGELIDARCVPSIPSTVNYHAQPIKEKARLRDLWEISESVNRCIKGAESSDDAYTQATELFRQYERRAQQATSHAFGFTASSLQFKPFGEIRWAIEGLLPEGLCVLGGRPKGGKSWWALQAAAAIAYGGKAFSKINVEKGTALYLGLEDSERRLQSRLNQLIGGEAWPETLILNTRWPKLSEGGIGKLTRFFREHHPRFVVLDTYARVRDAGDPRADAYDRDTAALAPLQELAQEHHVCVLLVLHLRKMPADDWIDAISGSTGLSGVPDALLGLFRKRGEKTAELKVTGRDIDERELAYRIDEKSWWVEEGPAEEVAHTYEMRQVCEAIARADRSLKPSDIASRLGISREAAQQRLYRMADRGLLRSADGHYSNLPGYVSPAQAANRSFGVNGVNPVEAVSPVSPVSQNGSDPVNADSSDIVDIADTVDRADSKTHFSLPEPLELPTDADVPAERKRVFDLAATRLFPSAMMNGYELTGETEWRKFAVRAEKGWIGKAQQQLEGMN